MVNINNTMADKSKESRIHKASMKILEETGIRIHNKSALQIFKDNGVRIEDDIVKFSEAEIMSWVSKAPSNFMLYARNPKYNVHFGGDIVNHAPGYGCAFIADEEGNQREGTVEDYIRGLKLYEANDDFDINGGIIVQPSDVPERSALIDMFYALFTHSAKCMFVSTGQKKYLKAILDAVAAVYGGREQLVCSPRVVALVNTNAPLSIDEVMLDNIILMAEYGQPVVVAASTMLGITGPVTIAGTLTCSNAEVLVGVALTQMIRQGTPVLYGMQSTASDMKTGQIAGASPEGTIIQGFGAKMAKYYGLPCRGGGCMTDAPLVNAQAGYESMMTCFSSRLNGINFMVHSAGIVASFNALSFEKMIMDFEVIRYVKRCFEEFETDDDALAYDLIAAKGHDGEFLSAKHTRKNFKKHILTPSLGSRGNINEPLEDYGGMIEKEEKRLTEKYETIKPVISEEEKNKVKEILCAAGIDRRQLEHIETL